MYYGTSGSYAISPADLIEAEHFAIMSENCDTDYDGSIDRAEVI